MTDSAVPVSMGSPRFGTWEAESALVTLLSFPGRTVLDAHSHDRPTFAVILNGGFDLVLTNSSRSATALACPSGTILTQPAGERHVNHIGEEGAHGVVLQPDVVRQTLPRRCLRWLDGIHHFRDVAIASAARRLAHEIAAPDEVTPLAVEGLVLEMLAGAARLDQTSGSGAGALHRLRAPRWLRLATDYVHEHFRESVRIDVVAAAAGVHPAHLAGVFRRLHGLPLGAYVRRLRVDWAAERLVATDAPIAVIAAEAGFADQAHLTRWFRRITGWSPAAFRKVRRQ